ncbi:MAG: hypothetical protein JO218_14050 [Burkholderiales bacterium]|nr:hypothetical protein [Burkholderiales bacterium]
MDNTPPKATLSELARWLRVEPGDERDRLELASAWQLIPLDSPSRTVARFAIGLVALIVTLLTIQAVMLSSPMLLGVVLLVLLGVAATGWWLRTWFWRTELDVDDQRISVRRKGWGVPGAVALPLDEVRALAYRMDGGHLVSLNLEHAGGQCALPYSGQRELDKLYCNILLHLLQKRRPAIHFSTPDESAQAAPTH